MKPNSIRFMLHTFLHKVWVLWYILIFAIKLLWRGIVHDFSKFSKTESEGYGEYFSKFKQASYGDKTYQDLLKQLRPTIGHHYRKNNHHPEHFKNGYSDMNLIDIVEMFCDWQASVKRQKDGDILTSIELCKERFGISDDLVKILKNSVNNQR